MKILIIYRLMFSFGNWETKFMNILQTVNMFLTFKGCIALWILPSIFFTGTCL